MQKTRKAFSIIELSIVILLVGVLIAALLKGELIIRKVRVSLAQTLTRNSPVAGISGLTLWLEPTLEESFPISQAHDGFYLTSWYDMNPQFIAKNNFIRSAASDKIKYEMDGINNLPSVFFNGGTETTGFVGNAVDSPANKFTFFIVHKLGVISNYYRNLFFNGSNNAWRLQKTDTHSYKNIAAVIVTGSGINIPATSDLFTLNPEIISITHDGTFRFYSNGTSVTLNTSSHTSALLSPTGLSYIGRNPSGTGNYLGFISEIIFFERVLTTEERKSVEKYLSKKYAIRVS